MYLNKFNTLSQAVDSLSERGFKAHFAFRGGAFVDLKSRQEFDSKDLSIVEYHRFEGMTNPADTSIVFAIETEDGKKGTLTMNYGANTGLEVFNFMDKVRIKSGAR